ncbi:xanthine dehydrogenase family protein molybdopterin-binding subunit [Paraburkholderia aspalathi]|nr:xanthine dehydrogenase family protein molybdopterin-binding subunit [Paraburkholderia aspalathi]
MGVIALVRPFNEAQADMMPTEIGKDTGWMVDGKLRYRRDGMAKVTGQKVFAIDARAKDLDGWPDQQSYALTIHVPRADRIYEGLDLSVLGDKYQPDVLIDAEKVAADNLAIPEPVFYGKFFVEPGTLPPMMGHPVALGIWHDYERFRVAAKLLQFNHDIIRFGAEAEQPARTPYVVARYVRAGGKDPYADDIYSPLKGTIVRPKLSPEGFSWPSVDDPVFGMAMRESARIRQEMQKPAEGLKVFTRKYYSQSTEPAAFEMENGLAWYDQPSGSLRVIGATQAPYATAQLMMGMVKASKMPLNKLDFVTGYTVGYGQKEHHPFPYYVAIAALYAENRPVRLAFDRWTHFQFALKRHPFDIEAAIAVDEEGKFRSFTFDMMGDGGGVMNFSPSIGTLSVASSQSAYYFPQSDLSVEVKASTEVTAGSVRGYGTLQSMAATEMLVDEIADEIGLDAIELRRRNMMRTGMKNTQGAIPAGAIRINEILDLANEEPIWLDREQRKKDYEAANPGMLYGVGFASVNKSFGTGAEAAVVQLEVTPDGRLKMRHVTSELGAGSTTAQMIVADPFLGRPVDEVEFSVQEWPQMPVHTKEQPYSTPQDVEDELAKDPYWVPSFTSPRSASNSAYYFTHATQQAAKLLLRLGLWQAALSIWGEPDGGQMLASPVSFDQAEWNNGRLVAGSLEPLSFERLAKQAHRLGLITGICVHTFNRRSWAQAEFEVDGQSFGAMIDALSVQWGEGADVGKKNLMTDGGYAFQPRISVTYPKVKRTNSGAVNYAPCATLVELAVSSGSGEVKLLSHKTWLECGNQIVPELVSGQIQGGIAMGIGHALYEELPLGPDGPGNGEWNFGRYHLPRASEVAVWSQTSHILPPLSSNDAPKGMAEVVMIPVVAACANAIAQATGHRFYRLPISAARIQEVL